MGATVHPRGGGLTGAAGFSPGDAAEHQLDRQTAVLQRAGDLQREAAVAPQLVAAEQGHAGAGPPVPEDMSELGVEVAQGAALADAVAVGRVADDQAGVVRGVRRGLAGGQRVDGEADPRADVAAGGVGAGGRDRAGVAVGADDVGCPGGQVCRLWPLRSRAHSRFMRRSTWPGPVRNSVGRLWPS